MIRIPEISFKQSFWNLQDQRKIGIRTVDTVNFVRIDQNKLPLPEPEQLGINIKINTSFQHKKDLNRTVPVPGDFVAAVFSFKYKQPERQIFIRQHKLMSKIHESLLLLHHFIQLILYNPVMLVERFHCRLQVFFDQCMIKRPV